MKHPCNEAMIKLRRKNALIFTHFCQDVCNMKIWSGNSVLHHLCFVFFQRVHQKLAYIHISPLTVIDKLRSFWYCLRTGAIFTCTASSVLNKTRLFFILLICFSFQTINFQKKLRYKCYKEVDPKLIFVLLPKILL